jgi:hypothetical protein
LNPQRYSGHWARAGLRDRGLVATGCVAIIKRRLAAAIVAVVWSNAARGNPDKQNER